MAGAEHIAYNAVNIALEANYRAVHAAHARHGSWQGAWHELRCLAPSVDADRDFGALAKNEIRPLLAEDAEFPAELKEIPWPPHGLYVRGSMDGLKRPAVAIVGTRKAT